MGAGLALVAFGDLEDWGSLGVFRDRPVASLGASVGMLVLSAVVAFVGGMKLSGPRTLKWGRVRLEAIGATAELTFFPSVQPTPRVGVKIKLYAVPPAGSEAIIPRHQVSMQVRLLAASGPEVCTGVSLGTPERPATGEPHSLNIHRDGEQVVIQGPGYLTVTGGLPVSPELEHAPPESIGVVLRFRPVGSRRSRSHKLTLARESPAKETTRRVEFRAQWGWRASAPL
jgi:hypothetical protein